MRKADQELLALNKDAHAKAQVAVALALRTDRRIDRALVAMPKLRDRIADHAALKAIGAEPNSPASAQELAQLSRDRQFAETFRLACEIAAEAAKKALKDIELRALPTETA